MMWFYVIQRESYPEESGDCQYEVLVGPRLLTSLHYEQADVLKDILLTHGDALKGIDPEDVQVYVVPMKQIRAKKED